MAVALHRSLRTGVCVPSLNHFRPRSSIWLGDAFTIWSRPCFRKSGPGCSPNQLEQLRKAGCSTRNIYREKVTGARADRRELNRMLGKLAAGDVVTVTRIGHLARSTFDLFAISAGSSSREDPAAAASGYQRRNTGT